MNLGLRINYA